MLSFLLRGRPYRSVRVLWFLCVNYMTNSFYARIVLLRSYLWRSLYISDRGRGQFYLPALNSHVFQCAYREIIRPIHFW
jgi:hypothetical protein